VIKKNDYRVVLKYNPAGYLQQRKIKAGRKELKKWHSHKFEEP